MNKRSNCDIIIKSIKGAINIMNRNSIISLAMIYALWQSNKQDLLDLIRPCTQMIGYAIIHPTRRREVEVTLESLAGSLHGMRYGVLG